MPYVVEPCRTSLTMKNIQLESEQLFLQGGD